MKFLKTLQDTKLSELTLLDLAYVVVLLPLIIILKAPMILFSIISIILIVIKRTPANNFTIFTIFILGIVALYLSLYGAFSFSGLSRLKLFLELLVYILIIVVTMQRLTRTINIYLLISPFLFLALSLFFYHSLIMLTYVIFEVFALLWLILSHRMQGDLGEGFKSSMVMFMYSLPWVVLLFIFFPRISFEHANYGFKGEVTKRMGHDGTMYLDGNALLVPSDRIVMEIGFKGDIPPASELYFRGSILYVDKKDHWEPLNKYVKRKPKVYYPTQGTLTDYKVTLYPTQKKWLYLLDIPSQAIEDSLLDNDLITTVKKNIYETIHYDARSLLNKSYASVLDKITYRISSTYNITQNPKTYKVAHILQQTIPDQTKRAKAVMDFFKSQTLTYTLKPDALDTNHATDSFLFDKRRGYCVHFASSFVTMARMAGIPARIVTGYKSDRSESLKNYLVVKEKDAHAWAELYIDKQWVRYETTTTASNIDLQSQTLAAAAQINKTQNPLLKKINIYLMYTKYQIETWVLYYSHVRQLQLLDYAKKNPQFVFGFVISIILLIIGSFMVISYFKRPSYSSEALALMQPLLKALKKQGYVREREESMHQFLLRYMSEHPEHKAIKKIDSLYEEILYGRQETPEKKILLKKIVKQEV